MDMQFRSRRFQLLVLLLIAFTAKPTLACEPVVPFMQVMVPTIALSGSMLVLAAAVVLKSVLFAFFERRLPRVRAAWRMFLGNILTSFVGLLVAVMIASAPSFWLIGAPLVCVLCWLPTRSSRQGGSVALVGPKIACGARWGDDRSDGGELRSVHGRPRGT
jgi:hypothetical protein